MASTLNMDVQCDNSQGKRNILCELCQKAVVSSTLLVSPSRGSELFRRFPDTNTILESSNSGCHLCSIIIGAVKRPETMEDQGEIKVTLTISRSLGVSLKVERSTSSEPVERWTWLREFPVLSMAAADILSSSDDEQRQPTFFTFQGSDDKNTHLMNYRYHLAQVSRSTAADASFSLARGWLHQCQENHTKCNIGVGRLKATCAATRLIDVGSPPKVVLTRDLSDEHCLKYLALSHSWGNANIIRLLLNNINSLKEHLPLDSLPQTFRDAIHITRQLGYRYLWVDSLCIIQDSYEDWKRESAIMGDVYSNADCTIAALTSSNSHGGCFVSRNPLVHIPCRITAASGECWYIEGNRTIGVDLRDEKLQPMHLHTRAWVVQERLLSPRTMYYGTMGLAWECVECSATELRPTGEESRFSPKASFFKMQRDVLENQGDLQAVYQEWLAVQIAYTRCSLTKFEDKLVALSAVIGRIEKITGWESVFGLWKQHFLEDLLWFMEEPSVRPDIKIAPSWSWASIIGRVMIFSLESENPETPSQWMAEVKAFGIGPESLGIKLQAPIRNVKHVPSATSCRLVPGVEKIMSPVEEVDWDPDVNPDITLTMACVLIVRIPSYLNGTGNFDVGLVVTRTKDDGMWKRAGLFRQMQVEGLENLFPLRGMVASSEITIA